MLSFTKAKNIGINACIDKLGRDFVLAHRDSACSAYGDRGDHVHCYVGVDTAPPPKMENGLWLTSDKCPYFANCRVDFLDGKVTFLECVLPPEEVVAQSLKVAAE